MWSKNTSSREELLHLTWCYFPVNAAPGSICCLLQGHTASLWAVCLLWEILVKNSGKEGSGDGLPEDFLSLCTVTQSVLFCNRLAFSLLILLLPIQWHKIALLSSMSLSTSSSRGALAFLTESLCACATILNPSFAASCCSHHPHSKWSSVVIYLLFFCWLTARRKEGRKIPAWRTCQVTRDPLTTLSSIISWLLQSLIRSPVSPF